MPKRHDNVNGSINCPDVTAPASTRTWMSWH